MTNDRSFSNPCKVKFDPSTDAHITRLQAARSESVRILERINFMKRKIQDGEIPFDHIARAWKTIHSLEQQL